MKEWYFLPALLLAGAVQAQPVVLGDGSLVLPTGFVHEAQRGLDSTLGVIRRGEGEFVVHYDIGAMAGTAMFPQLRAQCTWFIEHEVDGHRAYTGLKTVNDRMFIVSTVFGEGSGPWTLPANFSAEVHGQRDIAEFLLIVASYRVVR